MLNFFRYGTLALCLGLTSLAVHSLTTKKLDELRSISAKLGEEAITAKERERQLECLAINIYREAAHEPFEGKVGVAQVTMNRVDHPSFPKDVCAVVFQKNRALEKTVCQFSWYCDSVHRNRPVHTGLYQESYIVAQKVLLENYRLPSLTDALYYHADYVNPQWRFERINKIGRHIFYKPRV
jgi:spore germination cell wall hydrolase CwlJ-like protein